MEQSLHQHTLAHAYLFVGQPHVGKMTLALDLARALNCTGTQAPCGLCRSCLRILEGKHADVITIDRFTGRDNNKDKRRANEISIDAIRDLLQRSASLPPYEGKCKVFIIDNADLLSVEAANSLLKTLEEPPPRVVIILLTSEEKKLLPTVVSRCQKFELKPVPVSLVEKSLRDSGYTDTNRINLLARLSGGCIGWAKLAAQDQSYLNEREKNILDFIHLLTSSWEERFNYIGKIAADRNEAANMIQMWILWLRDVLLLKYNCRESVINIDHLSELSAWAEALTIHEIWGFMESLNRARIYLEANVNLHLLMEVLMIDMPKKEHRLDHSLNPAVKT